MSNDKTWGRWVLIALLGATLSFSTAACGDDDESDVAGDGDGDVAGDGDGDGATPTCEESIDPDLSDGCKTCVCAADAAAAAKCDGACFDLVQCAAVKCAGDTPCATAMCTEFLGATGTASAAGPAFTTCSAECAADFGAPDADAGI